MIDMHKDELEKKLAKNGWNEVVEKESKKSGYSLYIYSNSAVISFESHQSSFAHILLIYGVGSKKIKEDDFFAIISYLKEQRTDKPIVFRMHKNHMTDSWNRILQGYLEIEKLENLNTLKPKISQMIYMGSMSEPVYYTTEKERKKIEHYADYLFEIENVAKEHESKTMFFYSIDSRYIKRAADFFFSIEGCQYFIRLKMKNNMFKLCIKNIHSPNETVKEWDIHKKEDIRKYLQEYIEKTEKQQRIRNIYKISTYFFEKYCAENQIYEWDAREELLRYYTVKELEEISIKIYKNKNKRERIQKENKQISFFDDKAIFINRKKSELKVIADQEEIDQHIKEIKKNIS